MKKLTVLVLASLGALTLASCGNAQTPPVKDTFTVMFNTHGGSPVATMNDIKVIETSPVTTRDGYDFEGWYLSASYVSSEKVTFPYTVTADIMLHANWTVSTYLVHFEPNGGTPVEDMRVSSLTSAPVTSRDGYDFLGWFESATAESPITYPYTVTHEMTLYAKWEQTTYTVAFDSKGGTDVATMEHVLVIEEEPQTSRKGYDFDGWYTSLESTNKVTFPYEVDHNQTLVAKWTRDVTVTLLDGVADEDYWTNEVLASKYTLSINDYYYTDIMGVVDAVGVHIFAEQHVQNVKHVNDTEWWNNDNIEFRFGSGLEHIRPMNALPQKWISTMAGGNANMTNYFVSGYEVNPNTGLNDVKYEILLTYEELGLRQEDPVIFTAGVSYVNNQWVAGEEWDCGTQDLFKIHMFGLNGIQLFDYDFYDDKALSILDNPITAEWDKNPDHNWNSNVFNAHMDGSASWAVVLDMNSVTDSTKKDNDIGAGIVGEVYSPSWANGGWTFRKDWFGWGGWHNIANAYDYNYTAICTHAVDGDDWNNRVAPLVMDAQSSMNVKALINFNADTSKLTVNMQYTCSADTSFEGRIIDISYQVDVGLYRGEMIIGFGYNFSKITINSARLIHGAVIS